MVSNIIHALGGAGKRREDDLYPTPPEATIALLREVTLPKHVWEPACGDGAMAEVLKAHGHKVFATDLVDRGYGQQRDFLGSDWSRADQEFAIVTNPPFKLNLAELFIRRALAFTPVVCILHKATFPNAAKRLALFDEHPPSRVLPLTWRLDFTKAGRPHTDCTWFCWGVAGQPYKLLPKPETIDPEWLQ